jgi:CheY-like chemotaxis protein
MQRVLVKAGHQVKAVSSAAGAMELAKSQTFDILISDLGLPDGSGLEVMRCLRRSQPNLKGIAISGFGMDSDIQRSREVGFAEHLTKPIDSLMLEAAISRVISA